MLLQLPLDARILTSKCTVSAKAAIREMNKLAERFFLLSAENAAAHSIRIKLAILAIPTDLLATLQLQQLFSGDVHKNEMALREAVKKKKKKKIPYIKVDAALQWLPSPDSTEVECILPFVQVSQINSSNHESHHRWEGNSLKNSQTGCFMML